MMQPEPSLSAHERMLLVEIVGERAAAEDESNLASSLRQLRQGLETVTVELERIRQEHERA